jgi:hypothetical protein
MTYPPQRPGPYGQQPGPYGEQPGHYDPQTGSQPYGQQPLADPYGRQNGYGFGGGPGGTQQFPQTDGYGPPQDPYGRSQNDYPQQGRFAGDEAPRKKSQTGLIVAIVAAGVLVIGGVAALVLMNSGSGTDQAQPPAPASGAPELPGAPSPSTGKPKSSASSSSKATSATKPPSTGNTSGAAPGGKANPQDLATYVIAAYNAADGKGVTDATCRSREPKNDFTVPQGFRMESTGALKMSGETATMPVKASYKEQTQAGVLSVKKESGLWCLSGLGSS